MFFTKKNEGCHFRSEAGSSSIWNAENPLLAKCKHHESGSTMINEPIDIAFLLSEEESPVQSSSDYLQALLILLTCNFVWQYFVHFIGYHVRLWHGTSWYFLSLQSHFFARSNHSGAYTLNGLCHLCSKVDLMEEDHNLQVLAPMQNLVTGVVLQWPCKYPKNTDTSVHEIHVLSMFGVSTFSWRFLLFLSIQVLVDSDLAGSISWDLVKQVFCCSEWIGTPAKL